MTPSRARERLAEFARAQNTVHTDAPVAADSPFGTSQVEVSGNTVFVRRYGKGPAILMVHGFPRTTAKAGVGLFHQPPQSHGDLRRPARLRPNRDTALHTRPLSLFKARNGTGAG